MKAFPIFGNWITTKIGKGGKLRIGVDPWIRCSRNHRLSNPLIGEIHA